MNRIVLLYKRQDEALVIPLKEKIEAGTQEHCVLVTDVADDDHQAAIAIMKSVDEASIIILMYSYRHATIVDYKADWSIRVLNYAQEQQKRIVFVGIEPVPLTRWFEFMFPQQRLIDTHSPNQFQKLLSDIQKWLSVGAESDESNDEASPYTEGLAYSYDTTRHEASVIGCGDAFDAHINIPPVVMHDGEEYQVTAIEKEAFQRAYFIITINLPKNVTRIGKRAFDGCVSLVSITIPDGVTDIEKQTFRKCTSLVSVVFPSHLKHIHTMAFALCKGLTSLTLPDGLQRIGYAAFENCTNLSEVHIPDSIKRIGLMAFWMTSTPLGKKNNTRDATIMAAIWWIPLITIIMYVYYKWFA